MGKVTHIEVNQLWVLDYCEKGLIDITKADGKVKLTNALSKLVGS